jgi:predicted lipoprotein with Yx(FWY)xxD motif
MKAFGLPLLIALAALAAGGCGEESADGAEGTAAETSSQDASAGATASGRRGTRVKVVGSAYGRVIADRRGEAVYLFTREGRRPKCYGACAQAWPPLLAKGRPVAVGGAKQRLLGTTKRHNGKRQVTYGGHPLYYYVHDSPGQILCHDVFEFGGDWLVVKPTGKPAA